MGKYNYLSKEIKSSINETIQATFTEEQVQSLQKYQNCEWLHPLTCAIGGDNHGKLSVYSHGLICEFPGCSYSQYEVPKILIAFSEMERTTI